MRSLDEIFADAKGITYEEQVRGKKTASAATSKLKPLAEIFAEARQDKGTVARPPSAVPSILAAPKTPVAKPTLPISQAEKEILDAAMRRYYPGVASAATKTPAPRPRPLPKAPETAAQQIFGSLGKSIAEAPANWEKLNSYDPQTARAEREQHYTTIPAAADYAKRSAPRAGEKDTTYRYINGDTLTRMQTQMAYAVGGTVSPYTVYDEMTPEEKGTYNYLYAKEGKKAAADYLDDLTPTWNKRSAEKTVARAEKLAEEHPGWSSALGVAEYLGPGQIAWVDLLAQNANRALSGKPVDYNSPTQQIGRAVGGLQPAVQRNIEEATPEVQLGGVNIPGMLYGSGMSMLKSLAAGSVMGVGGAAAAMGASSAASEAQEIAARGGTDDQALYGGAAAGAFEAIFEKISLGNLKALQSTSAKGAKTWIKNILKSIFVNATEEAATEAANAVFDAKVLGDASAWKQRVDQYMAQGMTKGVAEKLAFNDTVRDVITAAASGGLMGFGFGVLGTVQGKVMNRGADAAQTEATDAVPDVESADAVTREYEQAVDGRVLAMAESVAQAGAKSVAPLNLGAINNAHADILRELTGVDYSGYTIQLTGDAVQHIINRHGENGAADSSMADLRDVARIGWVVENFDNAALTGEKTKNYLNSNYSPADVVLLQKRVNGNYYVAEAVPDTKKKTLYIQSAYKNKNLAGAQWNLRPPEHNARNEPAYDSDNEIPGGARWNQRNPLHNVRNLPPSNPAVDTNISQPIGDVNNRRNAGEGWHMPSTETSDNGPALSSADETLEDARWSQRPPLRNAQDLSSSSSVGGTLAAAQWDLRPSEHNVRNASTSRSAVDTNISQPTGNVNGEVDSVSQEPYTQNVGGAQRGEREALSDDGGQWDGRQRAGEQAGRLVEGAERTGRRAADRSREAIRRKNRAAELRTPLVSSREIGLEQGTERKTVRVMPEEIWDDGMRAIAEKARRDARVEITFVSGNLSVRGGDGAEVAVNGVFEPGRIIVQADNMKYSAEQIADHELYHDWVFRTPGVQMNVKRKVVSQYGEDEFNAIVAKYAQAMRGIVGITDDMSEDDYNQAMRVVEEEVFADAYAGINRRGDGATQFTEAVQETVRDNREANGERETRGPPEARYSMDDDAVIINETATRAEANVALLALAGKTLVNDETGIEAQINGTQRRKILSDAAVVKTVENGFTGDEHYAAAAHIAELWKRAHLAEVRGDRNEAANMLSVKRFTSAMSVAGTPATAYITAKESMNAGHRVYSLELMEIEETPLPTGSTSSKDNDTTGKSASYVEEASRPHDGTSSKDNDTAGRNASYRNSIPDAAPNVNRRFSANDHGFDGEVQAWYNETTEQERMVSPGYFTVGTTSEPLKSIGVREGKIYWRKSKIGYILAEHPEVSIGTIREVPGILGNPITILKSRTRDDSIVLFGEVRADNGNDVMVSLELTPTPAGSLEAEFSLVTSAYGRNARNVKNLVEQSEVLYMDKNRAGAWLMQLGVQFPSRQPSLGSMGRVTYQSGKVNITGVPFSQIVGEIEETPLPQGGTSSKDNDTTGKSASRVEEASRPKAGTSSKDNGTAGRNAPYRNSIPDAEPNVKQRFSTDDQEPRRAQPAAESRPIIAKRELKQTLLSLFSTPDGIRAELGSTIDHYADRLLRDGALTEEDRKAFFDRMYEMGVMEVPPDEYFSAGRGYIAGGRVYVNDEIRAEFGSDWNDFRKKAFGYGVYLTSSQSDAGVDVWGRDLSELVPGVFEEGETDGRTILERMVWVAQEGLSEKMSLAQYALDLSGREWINEDEYLDNMERQMDWALRTFAEKANLETRLRSRADSRISKDREREIASRARADERQKLAGQMERAAERESAAEKRYQDLQQKQRELIRRANTRAGRKEMTQKQRDNRVMKEWQQKTLRQLQWLSKNRRRAPAEWKAVWDETLGDIDIFAVSAARETAYSKKYGASWKDLAQIYTEAKEKDPNFLSSKEMETIVDRVYKIKLEDMDLDDLQTLYRMAAGLRTEFYNRNNVINDEKNRMFAEMYRDSKKEINDAPGGYVKGKFQHGADGFVNMQQLTPINVMQRMVGWNPNSAFFSMAKQLERGERDVRAHYVRANQLLETFLKENADWVSKADGQGKNATWYPVEVQELLELGMGDKPVFGDTIKVWMTPSQKVHLYLESRNEDSLRHMVGGRTFADKELYSQGKRREALEQGRTIRLAPESVMKIVADMTDTELELARVLDSYYNGYAKERINAVSNVLYGYDKAIGRNYAPIFANSNYVKQEVGVFNVTAEGVGNLKERQYSKNPSYNIGAFDAFERNVEQTARFVGMAIPARNLNTLLNWREKNNSMGDVITHKWGGEGKKYIEDILEDLQGGKQKEQSWFGKLADKALNNYISATFGFNPSIVLKQLGSIPLASAYLGVENTPNPAQLRRVDWGFVGKYTAELAHRTMGYTTPETKQLKDNPNWTQRNKAIRFLFGGGAITAMDGAAASVLWPWAENKVRRERPELEMGTQEEIDAGQSSFYKAVAEEFNDALNRSQSVSDQMHQSKLRKDRNPFARMFTMFRSDAAQTYNTLRQKIGEAQYYKRSGDKAAHRKVQRAAGAAVLAALVGYALVGGVDLLANLWKQMGKRYKDEEGNLTAESVFKEMAAGFAGNIFGVVAGGDTLADWIGTAITGERWYGLETPGATQINDLLMGLRDATDGARTAIVDAWNVLENGGDLGEYLEDNGADLAGGIKDAAVEAGTYIPGLPVKNVEAYLLGIVKWVRPEWATAYEDAFAEADKAGLAGLEGEALEARVAGILDNRLNGAKGEPAAALAGLYEAGFKKAIPSDTPSSISVDGESVELSAFQRQTYDLVWRGTVGASLDDLTASREFENASDENKEKMIDRLYRYAGEKAKLELFDGYEADGWVAKADEAVRSGMSAGDWATLYTEISLIDGDTTLKGAQKSNKKREVISHSGLPDAQKIMLYSHTISEERIDDIKAFQTAKLPFDVYLAAQNEYATLNEREDLTATQKATELSRWANQRGYTGEQAAAIRDTFTFFSMAPAEAKRYNELTDSGVDEEDAYELTNALNELEPLEGNKSVTNLQRYRETVDISTNPDVQLSLLMSVMGETEIQKVKLAYEYGVTPRDYVRAKELIEEDNKRKKAEDEDYGGVKNKDVEEVLEGMDDLERNQQAALYQVITRAKRNPFGARIRREIEKALEGE